MTNFGETKRYLESPACKESLVPFAEFITARHAAHGGVTEVRILGGPGGKRAVYCGYFDAEHWRDLVNAILPLAGSPRQKIPFGDYPRIGEANFYFSLRPVHPDLLGRVANCIQFSDQTTSDADIVACDMFGIDIDPVRKSQISASDEEKQAAYLVAEKIKAWFLEKGIKVISADSGNGFHLLIPTTAYQGEDLARATEDSKQLLHFLAERFDTDQAKVDLTVFNAARIMRLYGTLTKKGSHLEGKRPHRWASVDLKDVPGDIDLFGKLRDTLDEYKKEVQEKQKPQASSSTNPTPPSSNGKRSWSPEESLQVLEGVLAASGLNIRKEEKAGRTLFIFEKCPHHKDDDGHTFECCVMSEADGKYSASCKHDGDAHWKDFKAVIGWDQNKAGVLKSLGLWRGRNSAPAKPPAPPVDVDEELAAITEKWADADEKERNLLLTAAMGRLARCPAMERERAMEEIRHLTRHPRKLLNQALSEQTKILKEELKKDQEYEPRPTPAPSSSLLLVSYVVNQDQVNELYDSITRIILPTDRFYNHHGSLVCVQRGQGPVLLTEKTLPGYLSSVLEIAYEVLTKEGIEFDRFGVLKADLAAAFINSPRVIARFPVLNQYTRSPVFDSKWNFIGEPGYHEATGIYYDGPKVVPSEGTDCLRSILSDFCWKNVADLVNYVGMLVTGLTMPQWLGKHPMAVFNGSKPGVGKSLLARIIGLILDGKCPVTVSFNPNDEEFEKGLATRVDLGDRAITIDNAKGTKHVREIVSQTLERCITDPMLNFRRLGANKAISKPNDVIFSLTMNFTKMSRDLRRRSIPINLFREENVRDVLFPIADLEDYVLDHRLEILAELAGMVMRRIKAGKLELEKPARHSVSQKWAETIDAILRCSEFHGFLTNFEESEHAFDPDYTLMVEICVAHKDQSPTTAAEWARMLADNILEARFRDRNGKPKTQRAQATIVGSLFTQYLDTPIAIESGKYLMVCEAHGEGHPSTYSFKRLEGPQEVDHANLG